MAAPHLQPESTARPRVAVIGAGLAGVAAARAVAFGHAVGAWIDAGVVAPWSARCATLGPDGAAAKERDTERSVGLPGMNSVAQHLAAGLDVRTGVRVAPLARPRGGVHRLRGDAGEALGEFDVAIVTAPAPQAAELLPASTTLAERARAVAMTARTAVLLKLERAWDLPFDAAFVDSDFAGWAARNSSGPGRRAGPLSAAAHA